MKVLFFCLHLKVNTVRELKNTAKLMKIVDSFIREKNGKFYFLLNGNRKKRKLKRYEKENHFGSIRSNVGCF